MAQVLWGKGEVFIDLWKRADDVFVCSWLNGECGVAGCCGQRNEQIHRGDPKVEMEMVVSETW